MVRAACVTALAALALAAAPAHAEFATCDYDDGTVIATFPPDETGPTQGTLSVDAGVIEADGVPCDGATVTNTDTIDVIGDADEETVIIDLSGGPFAPGATDEATHPDEDDGWSEIEFHLDLQQEDTAAFAPSLVVRGADGTDHVTVGRTGSPGTRVNLNANETPGDTDVQFASPTVADVEVQGRDGDDDLSAGGVEGTGLPATNMAARILGGEGHDHLTCGAHDCRPGPGDDDVFNIDVIGGLVVYTDAAGPVQVDLNLGSRGGTLPGQDGDGGTDEYFGERPGIVGSAFDDVMTGTDESDRFTGGGGEDTLNGGAQADQLRGEGGDDTINAGNGADVLDGGDDDDTLNGEAGADRLSGGPDADDLFAGADDDVLAEYASFGFPAGANGADELHGGEGVDRLEYANPRAMGFLEARSEPVFVDLDRNPDDGQSGEGDNVMPDVENLLGGSGADTLRGDGDNNVIGGFDGADTLRGGAGDDTLQGVGIPAVGTFGEDQLRALVDDEGDDLDGEAGGDTIEADEGNDKIEARDGFVDTIGCGPGSDAGLRDAVDAVAADCEAVTLPVEMPAEPPVAPTADPPGPPPGSPPPDPPPPPPFPPPGAAPRLSQVLSLPSGRRCVPRRRLRIRVRRAARAQVRRVTIFVNGRRARSVGGVRLAAPIDVRRLPRRSVRLRLRVELTDGTIVTGVRRYRTCRRRG